MRIRLRQSWLYFPNLFIWSLWEIITSYALTDLDDLGYQTDQNNARIWSLVCHTGQWTVYTRSILPYWSRCYLSRNQIIMYFIFLSCCNWSEWKFIWLVLWLVMCMRYCSHNQWSILLKGGCVWQEVRAIPVNCTCTIKFILYSLHISFSPVKK